MNRNLRIGRIAAVAALVVGACSSGATPSPSAAPTAAPASAAPASAAASAGSSAAASKVPVTAAPGSLLIYGAASLTDSFKALGAAYTAKTGTPVTFSFDSSATLEAQIEQGAPADLFASADTTNPQKLVTAGLNAAAPVNFAGNVLTIIVPGSGTQAVQSPQDLAKSGIKVVAAGDSVPITKYANQLVANLAKQPGYPANFADAYKTNIVSKEDNVKGIVSKVELGEGDAGIVYVTDAKASTKVKTVAVPDAANVPATYAAVGVKGAANAAKAADFLTWLTGSDAQAILAKYGFLPPPAK
jgi:molybdate transport system substrate-binding protein